MSIINAWIQDKNLDFSLQNVDLCSNNTNVAFDFDGVITDPKNQKIKYLSKKGYDISFKKTQKLDILLTMKSQMPEKSKTQIKTEYDLMIKKLYVDQMNQIDAEKNALENLSKLNQKGFKIYVVTSRESSYERPEIQAAMNWLKQKNISITAAINTNNESKKEVLKQIKPIIYVDDSINKLIELYENQECTKIHSDLENTKMFLFNTSFKEQANVCGFIKTINSWNLLYSKIIDKHE
ncbi:5'-nucleotidase [Candidatus Woesearchaeota archaeon]|nr:5'-nucleotidase [Candidatus Woesearchaeota archaeon]MCF7901595.1 5'-nucleotidase [Candidatus Woesearchaeota archaeon]MCF8013640.1 5'-nucleotidase [Candidatus Woesearchaeota archaeon]